MYDPVETVRTLGGRRVHRFQVVRERGDVDGGRDDSEEWIVVGFTDEGVRLASTDLERNREVGVGAFDDGRFEPVVAGGVPVWGY